MFLQETKTKRGGKTYISYLVRESFRTANGPRGRTICNLTHLPKEVREMVGQALKGQSLVPLDRLEVNNIHCYGGCVVLEDAARRHGVAEWLAPLDSRSAALVRAMIFGGLLTAPSVAPFYIEARTARLAMFCGLDHEKERFDAADLKSALRQLDDRWPRVRPGLLRPPHSDARAIVYFRTSQSGKRLEMGSLGMDAEGIPLPLMPGQDNKVPPPLIALDDEMAESDREQLKTQPYLMELGPESLAALLRQLNPAQLADALHTGGPVEARHDGKRYILTPMEGSLEAEQEAVMKMGSLKELAGTGAPVRPGIAGVQRPGAFLCVTTNLPRERLTAAAAIQWTLRARSARAAFAPVQLVMGRPSSGEGVLTWRNHQNLQLLTHRLRCHLHADWAARGETRPVEDVLRDLQEVHRATLTVDGVVVRRLATHPSKGVAALLDRLKLWELFQTPDCGRK